MINVSRGLLPIYERMGKLEPNVIMATFPLRYITKGMSKYYKQGVHAIVPSQRAIPESFLDPKIKSRSRQHYQIANLEVKRQDTEAWALLLDPDGYITEGTGSNFFLIKSNKHELFTPANLHLVPFRRAPRLHGTRAGSASRRYQEYGLPGGGRIRFDGGRAGGRL